MYTRQKCQPDRPSVRWPGAIEVALHAAGFERPAFETIVASGPLAARPHHRPTDRRLETDELVLLDFGGVLDGYAVDLSRTIAPRDRRSGGPAMAGARGRRAGGGHRRATAPGRLPSAVDAAARQVLDAAGLGDALRPRHRPRPRPRDVHERPTIGPRGDAFGPLAPGMVFTVEPGVYVPDRGGVRIEDDVLVTAAGAERLTFDS